VAGISEGDPNQIKEEREREKERERERERESGSLAVDND
jgi:hypothetical protein